MKETINQDDMKQLNSVKVFNYIQEQKRTTRKQIEAATGLSWGAVSNITARLLENGFVVENKCEKGTGSGRIPAFLTVNGQHYAILGMDINITRLSAELINLKGESIRQWSCPADYSSNDALLSGVQSFLQHIIAECPDEILLGIGVAMQGIVDVRHGVSVSLPQCPGWQNIPLVAMLESGFGIPVYLEHDPNCVLRAEVQARQHNNLLLLRIDKGIGMALLSNGQIFSGKGMLEIGHTIVVPQGAKCACGGEGCLEAYASQNGLAKLAGMAFPEVAARARSGDTVMRTLFSNMALYLGIAINNILRLFNVDEIILCGDMLQDQDLFLDQVQRWLTENSFGREPDAINITVSVHEKAAYGAALLASQRAIENLKFQ